MAGEAGMIGGAEAGVGVESLPMSIGSVKHVDGGVWAVGHVVQNEAGASGRSVESGGRVGSFMRVGAKKKAVSERADATKVVDSEWKEEELVVDKVFEDAEAGRGAIDRELPDLGPLMQ